MQLLVLLATLGFVATSPAQAADDGSRFTTAEGFQLGTHTLSDVRAKLGTAVVHHRGDAGESEYSICYQHKGETITFISGELGGDHREILAVRISSRPSKGKCSAWPHAVAYTGRIQGLHLGMSPSAFADALAAKATWVGTKQASVLYESQQQAAGVPLDVSIYVEGSFSKGRLHTVVVSRTATN